MLSKVISRRELIRLSGAAGGTALLAACAPKEVVRVVKQTVVVVEEVERKVEVTKEVVKEVVKEQQAAKVVEKVVQAPTATLQAAIAGLMPVPRSRTAGAVRTTGGNMVAIQTVRGAIAPEDLGRTLVHEHIMVDFVGAAQTGAHRWVRDDVVKRMLPYLQALSQRGLSGFVDCTPMYLGRDPLVLKRLSELSGLHILTNTGLYKEPYLPPEAFTLSPSELAEQWIVEWQEGIEGTDVRPGFVKIAVHSGALERVQQTIVRAAAATHLATGLAVACHTEGEVAAEMSLDLIEEAGMSPRGYIIVHADQIDGIAKHCELARRGAWLEYDSIGGRPVGEHVRLVLDLLDQGYEDQLLISQDAGWYWVGEEGGGRVRPYTVLEDEFIPALRAAGVHEDLLAKLLISNPRRAFAVG